MERLRSKRNTRQFKEDTAAYYRQWRERDLQRRMDFALARIKALFVSLDLGDERPR